MIRWTKVLAGPVSQVPNNSDERGRTGKQQQAPQIGLFGGLEAPAPDLTGYGVMDTWGLLYFSLIAWIDQYNLMTFVALARVGRG
jgi:hypothetical protein